MTKRYRLIAIIFLLLPHFSGNSLFAQYNFYSIEYYHNPIYAGGSGVFHHYKVRLESDRKGKIIYSLKNGSGPSQAFIYEFNISDMTKEELNRLINENDIIGTENQFADDSTFGTSDETDFAKISYSKAVNDSVLKPIVLKTMSTPIFPKTEIQAKLKVFYDRINLAVPEEIWEKIRLSAGRY